MLTSKAGSHAAHLCLCLELDFWLIKGKEEAEGLSGKLVGRQVIKEESNPLSGFMGMSAQTMASLPL